MINVLPVLSGVHPKNSQEILAKAAGKVSREDLACAFGIAFAIGQTTSVNLLFARAHRELTGFIPCDNLNFSVHRFRADMSAVTVRGYKIPAYTPEQIDYYRAHALENPAAKRFLETRRGDAVRMSDLVPTDQWVNGPFWRATLADLGFRYSMNAIWTLNNNSAFVFNLNRLDHDFSLRDRHCLNLIYPFIGVHYQRLVRRSPPIRKRQGNRPAPHPALPPYELHPPRPDTLTPRELEVMEWVGGGKTNAEIAIILGISLRTVQKHVENILRKLDLENRYAIADLALSCRDEL